jgi:hypothetical protein
MINSLFLYSQYERINWIIFVDGKLPETTVFRGEFICFESTSKEKIIQFEYTIGDIKISTENLNYIKENESIIEKLTMKLYYQEFTKKTRNLYIYSVDISPKLLYSYDYVAIRIANLDKKKGIFHFGYTTDEYGTLWYYGEPYIFTKIDTEIHKRGTRNNTIIMKQKTPNIQQ